jgi:hypothetical protein
MTPAIIAIEIFIPLFILHNSFQVNSINWIIPVYSRRVKCL